MEVFDPIQGAGGRREDRTKQKPDGGYRLLDESSALEGSQTGACRAHSQCAELGFQHVNAVQIFVFMAMHAEKAHTAVAVWHPDAKGSSITLAKSVVVFFAARRSPAPAVLRFVEQVPH